MAAIEYFYGGSLRRTIMHFGRLFMGFQVSNGIDQNGNEEFIRVPCRYATTDRQALQILRGNTENAILAAPFISYYITNVDISRERTRNYSSTNTVTMAERQWDESAKRYSDQIGNTIQVERMNPSPINLEFNVDVWTTMIEHKLQLLEQIRLIYNPSLTMQLSTNPVDWIAMQDVELTGITFSSRSMPVGTDDALDIMNMTFKVDSWLSAPAKVTRTKVIDTIFTNIGQGSDDEDIFGWSLEAISRAVFTPNNHFIMVNEDYTEITLLDAWGNETTRTWLDLFNSYGEYQPGVTQIRIRAFTQDEADGASDVIGTVVINALDPTKVEWTIDPDTMPGTTLNPVDGVINPLNSFPGKGLPSAAVGQRYLLLHSIGSEGNQTVAWDGLVASDGDIIEHDGSEWFVDFDSNENTQNQFVGTIAGNRIYQWTESNAWIDPLQGKWRSGWWRLSINDSN